MLRSASNSGEGSLTTPIWQWSFESEPGLLQPTAVSTPTGWSYNYDPESGIFQWYTEGPNGWSTGDFGSNTIPLGESLSGFRLTSPLAPDLSIAEAIDTDFNSDFSLATVPVQAVPEPTTITAVALGAGILLRRRRRGRHERRPYQEEG
ncbi:MAG: PEP-CTERM sorting domain-containing protein [Fimbriimonas sp.]